MEKGKEWTGKKQPASSPYPLRKKHKLDADYTGREGNVSNSSWQPFSVEGWSVNILGFTGRAISVTTVQFCHCHPESRQMQSRASEHSCVPVKLYSPNRWWVLVYTPRSQNCTETLSYGTTSDVGFPLLEEHRESLCTIIPEHNPP